MIFYCDALWILVAAMILDALIGDPSWLYTRVPHPVALIGRGIGALERALYGPTVGRRARGLLVVALALVGVACISASLTIAFHTLGGAWGPILEATVASSFLAGRSLHDHAQTVASALADGVAAARNAVGHLVGRDVQSLDNSGVAHAAIESMAENLSDGLVAPLFWYVLMGLPGLAIYKTINTLDSMIGYRNARYRDFGWAAARLDDIANWIPARLTAVLLVMAAFAMPNCDGRGATKAAMRDARFHRSPNAGWPEAAVAGALNLRLGGPRAYDEKWVDALWLFGEGAAPGPTDISRALSLYRASWALTALIIVILAAIL